MTDEREALVAAVAADPDDDTPRLAFADWLDEHEEPDRAELVRLQCAAARSDLPRPRTRRDAPPERVAWDRRAAELFAPGWQRWFAPFFAALGTGPAWPGRYKTLYLDREASDKAVLADRSDEKEPAARPLPVGRLFVSRGFGSWLLLDVPGVSPAEAFRHEPLTDVAFTLGRAEDWARATGPALRRVRQLGLRFSSQGDPAARAGPVFDDPHLTGVRALKLGPAYHWVAPEALDRLVRSPLAARLRRVTLTTGPDGFAALSAAPPGLPWEEFAAEFGDYGLPSESVRRLVALPFRGNLRELALPKARLGDAGVAALAAAGGWDRLERLDLTGTGLTDAGLRALAEGPFAARLTHLRVGRNRVTDDGVRAVAAALDPDRVRELAVPPWDLSAEALAALRDRFGPRLIED